MHSVEQDGRSPIAEEFAAGRLGRDPLESMWNYGAALQVRALTADTADQVDPYIVPGCTMSNGSGGKERLVNIWRPFPAEIYCDIRARQYRLEKALGQFWHPTDAAVNGLAEMRDLAPAGTPTRKAAAAGRERLVSGLRRASVFFSDEAWRARYGTEPPVMPVADNDNWPSAVGAVA